VKYEKTVGQQTDELQTTSELQASEKNADNWEVYNNIMTTQWRRGEV